MAKTEMNESIDKIIHNYRLDQITIEKISRLVNKDYVDNYGNVLHAVLNYENDLEKVMKLFSIFLQMGVNPNYRGKSTGLTCFHLALYGYTTSNMDDCSYPEDFIVELIKLGIKYGLDVNIVDGDEETIAEAAIASEVYTGSVVKIIEALGPNFIIPANFIDTLNKYINIAEKSGDRAWYKHLVTQKDEIIQYINSFNIDNINDEIQKCEQEIETLISQIDLSYIKQNYQSLAEIINHIDELYAKNAKYTKQSIKDNRGHYLKEHIENILFHDLEENSKINQTYLEEMTQIATTLNLVLLLEKIKAKSLDYQAYLQSFILDAQKIATKNQAITYLENIPKVENQEELEQIAKTILTDIEALIDQLNANTQRCNCLKDSLQIAYSMENEDYGDYSKDSLSMLYEQRRKELAELGAELKENLAQKFALIWQDLQAVIAQNLITPDEVIAILASSSTEAKKWQKKK